MVKQDGNCFQVAGMFVIDNPEFILCHGKVTNPLTSRKHWHAWNEKEGIVVDNANGNKFTGSIRGYYEVGCIDKNKVKKYSFKEASKLMLKTKHFGNWDVD